MPATLAVNGTSLFFFFFFLFSRACWNACVHLEKAGEGREQNLKYFVP